MENQNTTNQREKAEMFPKGEAHVKGNFVKTSFQKNQETAPFQGYNFFGSKPKWDQTFSARRNSCIGGVRYYFQTSS